jgi:hypothetical protein
MSTVNGGTSVKFKSTEIQTSKRSVKNIEIYGGLQKNMAIFAVARGNRSRKTNSTSPQRIIPCSVLISGTSFDDLRSQIDTFLTFMDGVGNLDVDLGQTGTYRRWVAEPGEINLKNTDSPFAVTADFNFICVDPWGRDTAAVDLISPNATLTTSGVSTAVTFGGSTDQFPIITLTVNSFSGAASNTISIQNPVTGQIISITRTVVAGDVYVIDLDSWSVKVNGVANDYTGPLVSMGWSPGAGNILVTDDFTARNLTLDASNLTRYK